MDENQKINCTVSSCKYNNGQKQLCNLQAIIVTPVEGVGSAEPDESVLVMNVIVTKQNSCE